MEQPAPAMPALDPERMLRLHKLTREVSSFCRKQLRGHLDALALLLRPRRLLGDLMEGAGRESVVGADHHFEELQELFEKVAARPFDLRGELPKPLESVASQIQLHEWEYVHEARTERGRQSITLTSPLTWVITYSSTYSLSMLREVLAGNQDRDPEGVRAFVLRACLMDLLLSKHPELVELFAGLRYRLEVRKSPQMGELPLVTLSAPLISFRPPDDLLLIATGVSGGARFQELLNVEAARHVPDPLAEQTARLLKSHGESL